MTVALHWIAAGIFFINFNISKNPLYALIGTLAMALAVFCSIKAGLK